jgi:hypothetical protein
MVTKIIGRRGHTRRTGHEVRTSRRAAVASPKSNWNATLHDALREQLIAAVADQPLTFPLIAVIVPVLNRPQRVRPLVDSFRAATSEADARLYFVVQASDKAELAAIMEIGGMDILVVTDIDRSWAKKINRGYERTREPWLLLGADDLAFREGWVDVVRERLRVHPGVLGTNDLGNPNTISGSTSTHPLVRRLYADICGTVDARHAVLHEGYDHNYPDTELVETAKRRGLYLHAHDCVVEHLHPAWNKGTTDTTYLLGARRVREDSALFVSRGKQHGFG